MKKFLPIPWPCMAAALMFLLTVGATQAANTVAVVGETASGVVNVASAPVYTVRPQFAAPFTTAQELMKNKKGAEALVKLKEAQAVSALSPYEAYLLTRARAMAEYAVADFASAAKDFEAVLNSSLLPAADRLIILRALAEVAYNDKQYAKAADWIKQYLATGGNEPVLRDLLPQTLYLAQDYPAAAKAFAAQVEVETDIAAGRVPSEKLLRLLASAQAQAKDDAGYVRSLERLAVIYPKSDYWKELVARAVQITTQTTPTSERQALDVYRLKAAAMSSLGDAERIDYAARALRAGLPGEAVALLALPWVATAAPNLGASALREQAMRAAKQDKAQEVDNESAAMAAKTGDSAVNLGFSLALEGRGGPGIALMEQGIAKGGLKDADEARLHLGIAQWRGGRVDEALKTFQAVADKNGRLGASTPEGAGSSATNLNAHTSTIGLAALAHVWALLVEAGVKPSGAGP